MTTTIKTLRESAGLTQVQVAQCSKPPMAAETISRIERGVSPIGMRAAVSLRSVLGDRVIEVIRPEIAQLLGWV